MQIENNTWTRSDMEFLFKFLTPCLTSEHSERMRGRVEQEKRNSFSSSNYVKFGLLHKHLILKTRSRTYSRFKKRTICHSCVAIIKATDVSAVNWLSQTHVKNYCNFSLVEVQFVSEVEIPIKYSRLYNKVIYPLLSSAVIYHVDTE